ncbi:MAG: segregation/condensation protein A [Ruminococcaceae bacterium]|nr:segregation/condensation protein A [Oscillospiraceae bacterium]MBO5006318.1 segregation/condensation protein A [Clostridia bacterium]
MSELVFKTGAYEGPLELLLALIAKNKMNIFDIQIHVLFDQYMAYVEEMKRMDMEVAGEFITMAAELMLIKSKMLLPKQEEDPREELVRKLMEYKTAKEAASILALRAREFGGRFEKETDEIKPDKNAVLDLDVNLLTGALSRLLFKMANKDKEEESAPIELINPLIKKKTVSIPGKVLSIMRKMLKRRNVYFDEFFEDVRSRSELVATFYAVLELLKAGRISLEREYSADGMENILLTLNREHNIRKKEEEEAG